MRLDLVSFNSLVVGWELAADRMECGVKMVVSIPAAAIIAFIRSETVLSSIDCGCFVAC